MAKQFWSGVSQNFLGSVLAYIAIIFGPLVLSFGGARLMNASFLYAVYILMVVDGSLLTVIGFVKIYPQIKGTWQPSADSEMPQKLVIRITEGILGFEAYAKDALVILLHVHVDGTPTRIKEWTLSLRRGEEIWRRGYLNQVADEFFQVEMEDGRIRADHAAPLTAEVPNKGWLRFLAHNADQNVLDHLFGASFELVATDEAGSISSQVLRPGDWLRRAKGLSHI